MPTTNEQQEIQKMTAIANNEEQKPEVRINAARRLLRKTNFSSRSVRVGKRIAKLYFSNQDVSSQVRDKAASLLEFVLSKPVDDGSPLEEITPATAGNILQPKPLPPKRSVHDLNIGWDHPKQPKKFIEYYEPEDLPAFGVPADPAFKWTSDNNDTVAEVVTDSGVFYAYIGHIAYFVLQGQRIGSHGPLTCRVLNPKYVEAFKKWQSQYPRESNSVFAEELDLITRVVVARGGYRVPAT